MTKRPSMRGFAGLLIVAAAFFAYWKSPIFGGGDRSTDGRAIAATPAANGCGCYRDTNGSCFCGKKAKCGCPGECEPKGCEEKRDKQLERDIAAETKKATTAKGARPLGEGKGKGKGEDEGGGEEKAGAKEKAQHLSAAQKKELAKLLDAYLSEHPEGKSQTLPEVRTALGK